MTRLAVAQAWVEEYTPPNERAIEMARMYAEERLSLREIAEHFGISRQRVHQIIQPFGLEPHYGRRTQTEREAILVAAHARIQNGELTVSEAAEELGYASAASLRSVLRELGLLVPRRRVEHGTRRRYDEGCHCDLCTEAMRAYKQDLAEREPPEHGTVSGYVNYRCRCPECTRAASAYQRELRARSRQAKEPDH